jgi:ABC-type phosphate transport system substrate-binding protein
MLKRIIFLMCLCVVLAVTIAEAQSQSFVVIVNAANPVTSLTPGEISDIFLKRTTRWKGSKLVALPVDLSKRSPVREAFTKRLIARSVSAVGSYWQQQIFSGKAVPPVEKTNEADVVAFVRANPGAVGYVAAGTELGSGVKAVLIRDR